MKTTLLLFCAALAMTSCQWSYPPSMIRAANEALKQPSCEPPPFVKCESPYGVLGVYRLTCPENYKLIARAKYINCEAQLATAEDVCHVSCEWGRMHSDCGAFANEGAACATPKPAPGKVPRHKWATDSITGGLGGEDQPSVQRADEAHWATDHLSGGQMTFGKLICEMGKACPLHSDHDVIWVDADTGEDGAGHTYAPTSRATTSYLLPELAGDLTETWLHLWDTEPKEKK